MTEPGKPVAVKLSIFPRYSRDYVTRQNYGPFPGPGNWSGPVDSATFEGKVIYENRKYFDGYVRDDIYPWIGTYTIFTNPPHGLVLYDSPPTGR